MAFSSSSLFDPPPRRTISWSHHHRRQCQLHDQYIERLDNTEVLGGEDSSGHHIGHTGCVNALSWSPSGRLLASGSDDRNIVLWRLGSDHINPSTDASKADRARASRRYNIGASRRSAREQPTVSQAASSADLQPDHDINNLHTGSVDGDEIVEAWPQRNYPSLDVGMLGKIETGHRANIFSVKWAPNASECRLFTCAGDSHVRVFDINYMSAGTSHIQGSEGEVVRTPTGREYNVWPEHSGACVRLFRCHRGRAKRISTEVSPDVFLTCGEDGDVRQMDLRVPHTCRSRTGGSCPPPLAHYPSVLYSLSVSKVEPWLFAVAGEAPLAYLHDRRMIPRLTKRDWGLSSSSIDQQRDALTMCVRSFGIPPGGFEAPWAAEDGRTALVDRAPPSSTNRRLLMGNRNSITACKLSEHNGRDLLVSYSSGHIYRFDIYDEPGVLHANLDSVRLSADSDQSSPSPAHEDVTEAKAGHTDSADEQGRDLEEGQQHAGQRESELDKNIESDDGASSIATESGEMDHDEELEGLDSDIEAENSADDADDGVEIVIEDMDEEESDRDEPTDSDDEGGLSDDDLMHLLQEDENQSSHTAFDGAHDVPTVYPRSAYRGHCNKETVKDVAFAGGTDNYVISGSDDGNWFMWDKLTAEIKGIWHGDSSVVNVMAMHPDLPVFAISGIDDTIKIFAPVTVTPFPPANSGSRSQADTRSHRSADRLSDKEEICRRNESQIARDLVSPAANILWRLHPRLLGLDLDPDTERQIEGDCVIM
ncbi:hypothetical protein PHBOTO_004382 [Pseudozyma hubeiensis]|nr:hypothetical protein PHBOTO_004382 [Pseudozyma hubeiensis]